MHLDPDRLTRDQRQAVASWLEANGCRDHIALEPVTVRGRRAWYTPLCRKDPKAIRRIPVIDGVPVRSRERSVRIRVPLAAYLPREPRHA